ncbi:MAG: hypothetical protein DMF61_14475 [Blastocatellia bacterium AA13]|nr:MAG: hypothetical protein DMF61_14475 [Blastocatellia bacterium AA13]
MKIYILAINLLCLSLAVTACKKANTATPVSTNSVEANTSESKPATLDLAPTVPVGIYTMSEVQQKKKVTMVPPNFAVRFAFQQDGSFSRTSKRAGQVVHTDGGKFQITGKDDLILEVSISNKNPVSPPTQRMYKFTLSRDGSELSLLGTDGKLAVFRRESKGPSN